MLLDKPTKLLADADVLLGGYRWFRIFLNVSVTEVRNSPKFSKILRIEIENCLHHHDNWNVLNRASMDIDLINSFPVMAVH
jgi:hypothetical protein